MCYGCAQPLQLNIAIECCSEVPAPRRPLLVSLLSLVCWCGCLGALAVSAFGLMSFAAPDYWVADNMSFFF
ncbi:hypothetical protein QW131_16430 [Roseibium salinum]|nr:hypothetical protein [Roseibium salinum]